MNWYLPGRGKRSSPDSAEPLPSAQGNSVGICSRLIGTSPNGLLEVIAAVGGGLKWHKRECGASISRVSFQLLHDGGIDSPRHSCKA